jgi:hypothetical protein
VTNVGGDTVIDLHNGDELTLSASAPAGFDTAWVPFS